MKLLPLLYAGASLSLPAIIAAPTHAPPQSDATLFGRDDASVTTFEHADTDSRMDIVTNSGVCETTPGVRQYSGYFSVGQGMNMFFWFFEARHNPEKAPLALWLNGGPGCSSLIGLFQENGPCHFVNGDSQPSLNPNSWNEYANMLYVDQPIGTGFSYGRDPVDSTVTAAPYVWAFMQAFFTKYPQYENRDFGIFTESYGGHYGPEFADYFNSQNSAVAAGKTRGQKINLIALSVGNGWFDPAIQFKAYVDYAYDNPYRRLINETLRNNLTDAYNTKCLPELKECDSIEGEDGQCTMADNDCNTLLYNGVTHAADFDVYDIRSASVDPQPPDTYLAYLNSTAIRRRIGAQTAFSDCAQAPYVGFARTGDDARSFEAVLGKVVASGVQTVIWAGDADWICNAEGGYNVVQALEWPQSRAFSGKRLAPYTVNGQTKGSFKTVGNLSWLKVFDAGHEVPYYQPETALQVFKQTMMRRPLSST